MNLSIRSLLPLAICGIAVGAWYSNSPKSIPPSTQLTKLTPQTIALGDLRLSESHPVKLPIMNPFPEVIELQSLSSSCGCLIDVNGTVNNPANETIERTDMLDLFELNCRPMEAKGNPLSLNSVSSDTVAINSLSGDEIAEIHATVDNPDFTIAPLENPDLKIREFRIMFHAGNAGSHKGSAAFAIHLTGGDRRTLNVPLNGFALSGQKVVMP